jgi:hypothetical protein
VSGVSSSEVPAGGVGAEDLKGVSPMETESGDLAGHTHQRGCLSPSGGQMTPSRDQGPISMRHPEVRPADRNGGPRAPAVPPLPTLLLLADRKYLHSAQGLPFLFFLASFH